MSVRRALQLVRVYPGVKSTRALAKITGIDTSGTAAVAGIVGVITAADIPGDNKAYTEPLLAGERRTRRMVAILLRVGCCT